MADIMAYYHKDLCASVFCIGENKNAQNDKENLS